jgi:hypothetical protein
VTERLDEIGAEDDARFWLPGDRIVYVQLPLALEVWLPSLRRRAERHALGQPQVEHRCRTTERRTDGRRGLVHYDEVPCPDYRDLCAEIGIDPEESA